MHSAVFFSALPGHDIKTNITQKLYACDAKRPSLIKLHWTHTQDLHVTIAYIRNVAENEQRLLGTSFSSISKHQSFMARVKSVRLYGTALVLCLDPYDKFLTMHKHIKSGLKNILEGKYSLQDEKRFDPHITIARLHPNPGLSQSQKMRFVDIVQAEFQNFSFMIQQAALMKRLQNDRAPHYQVLQPYNLSR